MRLDPKFDALAKNWARLPVTSNQSQKDAAIQKQGALFTAHHQRFKDLPLGFGNTK